MSGKKQEIYYEVWGNNPASWLFGNLLVNRKQLEEILRKTRATGDRVNYRVKEYASAFCGSLPPALCSLGFRIPRDPVLGSSAGAI